VTPSQPNSTFQMVSAFEKHMVLHHTQPNPADIQAVHRLLNRVAPDLVPMILGGEL
jgi:hypothetical protein